MINPINTNKNKNANKNKKIKRVSAVLICLILLSVFLSVQSIQVAAVSISPEMQKYIDDKSISPQIDEMLDLYEEYGLYGLTREEALDLMIKIFIRNNPDMVPEMADALLRAFDDYGGYYANTSMSALFDDVYWGYGIDFDGKISDGNIYSPTVKRVFKNSPAHNAGLDIGDEIVKINNISVEGLGLKAVSNLMAAVDDKAEITVKRNGKELKFKMKKDAVFVSSILFRTVGEKKDTAWITVNNFTDPAMPSDFDMITDYMIQEKYKNLIIDLRNNTGGSIDIMAETLNILMPEKRRCFVFFR